MIDQNDLKSHKEIMKCSYLENFEAFCLQLCYQPNSFTGVAPLFSVLLIQKLPVLQTSFGGYLYFMLIEKKPLKNGTNRKKVKPSHMVD